MPAPEAVPESAALLDLVLITGMSGSGKSVALRALEDAGYSCVDNLPPELLQPFLALPATRGSGKVAVAIDARSAQSLPLLPRTLRGLPARTRILFLDASDPTLTRRFSETRRRHPLTLAPASPPARTPAHLPLKADADNPAALLQALSQAIARERTLLHELRERAHVIDTSHLHPAQLASQIKDVIAAPAAHLTLVFQSFGFKRGAPLDADYVFDVRMLPNPYYENALRPLTGRDAPVADYLARQSAVARMQADISAFLQTWLPLLAANHRSYVTVAIGCTGGQHRSVYLVEQLARHFRPHWLTLTRHRELDRPER